MRLVQSSLLMQTAVRKIQALCKCVMHVRSGQHTQPIAERQLASSVSLQDGTPLLHVVESCAVPEHGGITLRHYAIHSVDDDTAMVAAQRATSGKSHKSHLRKEDKVVRLKPLLMTMYDVPVITPVASRATPLSIDCSYVF